MRFAAIVALAVFGASCAGSDDASDRPRNSAADSAFYADSAILAAIVERDAAERRRGAGTQTSGGFAPYTGGGPTAPPTFSRTDPAPGRSWRTSGVRWEDRKSTRLNSSHVKIS